MREIDGRGMIKSNTSPQVVGKRIYLLIARGITTTTVSVVEDEQRGEVRRSYVWYNRTFFKVRQD